MRTRIAFYYDYGYFPLEEYARIVADFEASWVWFRFFYGPVLMGSVR